MKVNSRPPLSTAAQNDADGHETEVRSKFVSGGRSIAVGVLQELPLKVVASPSISTAAQNDADAHDTELSW